MITFTLISSCVRGYHVYRDAQNPSVGKTVNCECEGRNVEDPYTVALGEGWCYHWSHPSYHFMCVHIILRHGGGIQCTVPGSRKYSHDLLQGGLELPCTYRFAILLTLFTELMVDHDTLLHHLLGKELGPVCLKYFVAMW